MSNEWIFYGACVLAGLGALSVIGFSDKLKLKPSQNGGKKTRHRKHKMGKNTRRK
jgi:hypothetical protein